MEETPLSVLIVDQDSRSRNYLATLLTDQGYVLQLASAGKEGYISALRDRPDVIIFDPGLADLPAMELVKKLRSDKRTATTYLIALAAVSNPAAMADLLGAGCNEYLVKSQEAIEKLLGILSGEFRQIAETQPIGAVLKRKHQGGILTVFLSAKGGTGTSSLCANLAQNVANSHPGMDLAVMDLVLPIGSIDSIVGYKGDFNLIEAAAHKLEDLNGDYLRRMMTPLDNWGFRLLAGSPDPESAISLDASHIPVLIRAFRQAFDLTFVDLGRSLSRISLPIIQEADVVVIVTSSDLATVTLTQSVSNYLKSKGLEDRHVYMLLNRAIGLEGLSKSDAENIIGTSIRATIPYMGASFTLANNQHLPILMKLPHDTAAMMIDQVSRQILDVARQNRE